MAWRLGEGNRERGCIGIVPLGTVMIQTLLANLNLDFFIGRFLRGEKPLVFLGPHLSMYQDIRLSRGHSFQDKLSSINPLLDIAERSSI